MNNHKLYFVKNIYGKILLYYIVESGAKIIYVTLDTDLQDSLLSCEIAILVDPYPSSYVSDSVKISKHSSMYRAIKVGFGMDINIIVDFVKKSIEDGLESGTSGLDNAIYKFIKEECAKPTDELSIFDCIDYRSILSVAIKQCYHRKYFSESIHSVTHLDVNLVIGGDRIVKNTPWTLEGGFKNEV